MFEGMTLFTMMIMMVIMIGPWIMIVILQGRLRDLRTHVQQIEYVLLRLQQQQRSTMKDAQPSADAAQQRSVAASSGAMDVTVDAETPAVQEAPKTEPATQPLNAPVPPPPHGYRADGPPHARTRAEVELLVGGTWLNRIGAIALVLGTLFFLKYAIDNNWITEWTRVAIGLVAGSALVLAGERWRRKGMQLFAQGLAGAGVPILYLSVYASYGFYDLVSQPVAFAAMCVVTALSVAVALRHDAHFIGIMAAVAGMMTPAWLATGDMHTVGLFGYVSALSVGLFAIAFYRPRWNAVSVIAYVGTWLWWLLWTNGRDTMAARDVPQATIFAALGLLIGMTYYYLSIRRRDEVFKALRHVFVSTHIVVMFAAVLVAVDTTVTWQNELASASVGILLLAVSLQYQRINSSTAITIHRVLGLLVLTWGIGYEADAFAQAVGWSVLGVSAVFILRRQVAANATQWPITSVVALLITLLGVLMAILDERSIGITSVDYAAVINLRMAALAVGGLALIIGTQLFEVTSAVWRQAISVIRSIGYLALVLAVHREVFDAVAGHAHDVTIGTTGTNLYAVLTAHGHALAAMTSVVFAAILLGLRDRLHDESTVYAGLTGLVIGTLWWFTHASDVPDPSVLQPYVSNRALTGVVIVLSILAALFARTSATSLIPAKVTRTLIGIILLVFSFGFLTIEVVWTETITMHILRQQEAWNAIDEAWNRYHLRMSGTWIVYSIVLMVLGFARRLTNVRLGALVLLVVTILKVFLYDLSFLEQPYRIVSFIALGSILLAAGFMYQRFKYRIVDGTASL